MSRKITSKELTNYIKEQIGYLSKIEVLKEQKSKIEKEVKLLSENQYVSKENIKEGVSEKGVITIDGWITEKGTRGTAVKLVDYFLKKMIGLDSSDLSDSVTFSKGLDMIEKPLAKKDYNRAYDLAKNTAKKMIKEEGGENLF